MKFLKFVEILENTLINRV